MRRTIWSTVAVLALFLAINVWAWRAENLLLSLLPVVTMIVGLYVFNMSYGFFVESRTTRPRPV